MTMINEPAISTLGRKLSTARKLADLKQEDVARAAGVSRQTVSQWENGETEPAATKLFAIARVTKQPLGWFAEGLIDVARLEGLEPPTFWSGASTGAAGFWSDARALSLAELWCQVETDTESTRAEAVSQ